MKYWIIALLLTGCVTAQPENPASTEADGHTSTQLPGTAGEMPSETTGEAHTESTSATELPIPEATTELVENSAWVAYGASEDALGVIVNEPFSCELAATVT